jgi:hypothetical protein
VTGLGRGTVVVDGYRFVVADVRLRDGGFVVIAKATGPQPERHGRHAVTVFGEDGAGVYQSDVHLDHASVGRGDGITVVCPIRMVSVTTPSQQGETSP